MKRPALYSISAMALAAALGAPALASAQAAAAPGTDQVDAIIVTGTRSTARTVTSSLAPIDVIPSTELVRTGKQSPRDLIATLVPSATASQGGAGASFAVKTVSLRGLSADQTLVLVNGKRRHNTAILFVNGTTQNGQSPPDLDLIPSSAIDRIEVLRDGASAQYGSDALAGVINLILKKKSSSGSLTGLWGQTFEGDGDNTQVSGNVGVPLGPEGHVNLSFDYRSVQRTDRGQPNTSVLYPLLNGRPDPRETTANRYVNHPGQPATQLYSFGYDLGSPLAITDKAEFYAFGTVTSRDSSAWLTFRNPNASNNQIAIYPDGYVPKLHLQDRDWQHTAGFKGSDLFGATLDLSTSLARDDVGYIETSALNASLGPASPTKFYIGTLRFDEWSSNLDLTHEYETGMFKPLLVAVGGEYRSDTFKIKQGEPASYINGGYVASSGPLAGTITQAGSQGVTGFPPFSAGTFSRSNVSLYGNLEQSVTSSWDVSVAGRFEHYSDFGDATTYKASTRFEPVKGYAVRATASTGFRAPSLQQEHYASSSTIGVRLPGDTVTSLYPVQLLPPDTAAAQALGAAPLKPEKSVNYSVGLVLQPIPRLNVTVDLYQIKITNRILQSGTLGPATVVSNALRAQGLNPQQAVFYYANAADTRTRGLDIVAEYRQNLGDFGALRWTFSANFSQQRFIRVATPPPALASAGLVLIDRAKIGDFTVGNPKDKFILSANYTVSKFDATLRLTRYGKVQQISANGAAFDETVSPRLIADLDVSYHITDNLTATVGANNLFNAYPDKLMPSNQGTTGFAYYNTYSPYGISGGFYYGRLAFTF